MIELRTVYRMLAASVVALLAVDGMAEPVETVNGVRVDGAEPGEWTHDWDAATEAAKKNGKPVFVNFTGSDWCGWCKLLNRQVFSQPEWGAWASNNVYLVHIDFPNDKELVPEKYRSRNRELASRYKVGGYPTCYLLDPSTLKQIGRFGASQDITAEAFIEKVAAKMPGARNKVTAADRTSVPGESPVFDIRDGLLVGVQPTETETIEIPKGVKTVGIKRLRPARNMRVLVLPEGVETIERGGDWGYRPDDPLETIRIPASVRTIRPGTFYGRKSLATIDVAPDSPFSVKDGCLIDSRDGSLLFALPSNEMITVPAGVKSVSDYAFDGNGKVREIVLPDGVESIGVSAFHGCRSLESISLPKTLRRIGDYAFSYCEALSDIKVAEGNPHFVAVDGLLVNRESKTLLRAFRPIANISVPADVKRIANGAFSGLKQLISATVPDTVSSIGNAAFAHCTNLKELRIPERVDHCGGGIVRGCRSLESIRFPVGLTRMDGQDLNGTDALSEIELPNGLLSVRGWKTVEGRNLVSIFLPASVTDTDGTTFGDNPRLQTFSVHPDNSSFQAQNGVLFSKDMTRLVRFPGAKGGVYEIPATVIKVDESAFAHCRNLTEIRIPASVETIGYNAFADCPAKTNRVAVAAPGTSAGTARNSEPPAESPDFVNGVRVDGANLGEWTHDWAAATAAAKKDGKPVFVNFTGSDWCGWCKLLKSKVFSQPEWGAWASNNVYLVHLDFPKDKDLVPEKYRDRNRELASRYKVGGYPTCYLLDPSTLEPIGRFGASKDITAEAFVEQVAAKMPGTKTEETAKKLQPPAPRPPRPAPPGKIQTPAPMTKTGTAGRLPIEKLPAEGRISWFDFSEGNADKVKKGRSFDCRNVAFNDGSMRFNGIYVHSAEGKTNGCNAELRVPELDFDGFTVALSFKPEFKEKGRLPLLNFGHSRRWFSANIGANGRLWFGFNCYDVQLETEGIVSNGEWNWLVCSVDAVKKTVRASLNGVRLADAPLPKDFFYKILPDQVESMKTIDTTFWNGGNAFKGEIADFVLFGHSFGEDDFKTFSVQSAPSKWTAEIIPSKSLYWNAMISNAQCRLPARVDEHGAVILHPGLRGASGCVDLRGPISDGSGRTLRLVGIGQNPAIEKPLFSGLGGNASAVLLPDTIEWIGNSGFKDCQNLRSLKIPASVKRIDADAFADCPALERIEFEDRSFRLDDRVFGASRNGEKVRRPSTNLENE